VNTSRNAKYAPFGQHARLFVTIVAAFLGAVLLPEIGFFSWTPVRGDSTSQVSPAVEKIDVSIFSTPWIVPDPPPLRAQSGDPQLSITTTQPTISIKASNISWVTVCVDGHKTVERLFEAGSVAEIPFSQQAVLRSGNAGALEVEVGGRAIGSLGPWGAIRMIKATPSGYQFVEPVITNTCDPA